MAEGEEDGTEDRMADVEGFEDGVVDGAEVDDVVDGAEVDGSTDGTGENDGDGVGSNSQRSNRQPRPTSVLRASKNPQNSSTKMALELPE